MNKLEREEPRRGMRIGGVPCFGVDASPYDGAAAIRCQTGIVLGFRLSPYTAIRRPQAALVPGVHRWRVAFWETFFEEFEFLGMSDEYVAIRS